MSVAPTTANGDSAVATALADVTSARAAVRGMTWASSELRAGGGDLGQLTATDSPLSALSAAGFESVRQLVSFLDEPLRQLAGDPSSVSESARQAQDSGTNLSALAASYQASSQQQTNTWTGTAADGYRSSATQYANGIAALGQATSTLSSATLSAGQAVAQTAQGVRADIAEATSQMLPILAAAQVQAGSTNGASMAQAVPQCVQIADSYGQKIVGRMQALLSSGQNLKGIVDKITQAIEAVQQALDPGTEQNKMATQHSDSGQSGGQPSSTSATGSTSTSSTSTATNASNQTSADQNSAGETTQSDYADSSTDGVGDSTSDGTSLDDDASNSTDPTSADGTSIPSTAGIATPQSFDASTFTPGLLTTTLVGSGDTATSGTGASLGAGGIGGVSEGEGEAVAAESAAAVTSASKTSSTGMLGGGQRGASGAQRDEDKEHKNRGWVRGERGLFDPDEVTPAVIDSSAENVDDDNLLPRRTIRPRTAPVALPPRPVPQPVQPAQAVRPSAAPAAPAESTADESDDLAALAELDELPDAAGASAPEIPDVELVEI